MAIAKSEIEGLKQEKSSQVQAEADRKNKKDIASGYDQRIFDGIAELEDLFAEAMRGRQSEEWQSTAQRIVSEEISNQIKFKYAVTAEGEVIVDEEKIRGSDTSGRAAHSELAKGRNVYGAGELVFDKTGES